MRGTKRTSLGERERQVSGDEEGESVAMKKEKCEKRNVEQLQEEECGTIARIEM